MEINTDILFAPFKVTPALEISNRIVMAPMTRRFSPNGVPGDGVATYYRRRAEGGVGLIVTEGAWVPHRAASNDDNVPKLFGEESLKQWRRVVDEVHAAGGKIAPQLWHVGQVFQANQVERYTDEAGCAHLVGPSGMVGTVGMPPLMRGSPASQRDIDDIIEAFALAAESAKDEGFDALELHGAHGYIFDQFNWNQTNLRNDQYGGGHTERARFAVEVVSEMRRRVGPDFPIIMRMSQWKIHEYDAKLAETPQELALLLQPMAEAGVDVFHCSQRRFWEGEFGTDLNLAGWAKKLTGCATIAVGSVSMAQDFITSLGRDASDIDGIDHLLNLMERGDFDMIAIGRALLSDPQWPAKVRQGRIAEIKPYDPKVLSTLY